MSTLRMLLAGFAGVTVLALLAACADAATPEAGPAQPSLAGTSWILATVVAGGEQTDAVDSNGSLNFVADGSMAGSTGCNRFMGTWSVANGALRLEPGGQTLRACPDRLQAQEAAVLAALTATAGYAVDDKTLTLSDEAGEVVATYTAAAAGLSGTAWSATGVNNGDEAVVSDALTPELTLQFTADGAVEGFGGCTGFTGRYTTDGAGIGISELAADGCADAQRQAAQETYLAALAAATTFRIDGTTLELRDDTGALQVGLMSQ